MFLLHYPIKVVNWEYCNKMQYTFFITYVIEISAALIAHTVAMTAMI